MMKAITSSIQKIELQSDSRRDILKLGAGGVLAALLTCVLPLNAAYAQAGAENSQPAIAALDYFLNNVNSMQADFVQVVIAPNSDRTRTSSGTFALSRPNRFRFDYTKPYEQLIVSDGKSLWLYDKDLEQVTQRAYSSAMASTPAALLAGASEATMAQKNFTLTSLPDADGLQWVEAKPKQEDGQINTARIGFRHGVLEVLEIVDNFRQKSTLTFSNVQVNPQISNSEFSFAVPDGIDLINE
ncbi:MAG: outer membrane lipoprotein chaperone LolA [Saezia sp.]